MSQDCFVARKALCLQISMAVVVACCSCRQRFEIPTGDQAACPFCATVNQAEPVEGGELVSPPNSSVAVDVPYPEVQERPAVEKIVEPATPPGCGLCFYACCRRPVTLRKEPIYCLLYPCDIFFDVVKLLLLPFCFLWFGCTHCSKSGCCANTCGGMNRMLKFDTTREYIAETEFELTPRKAPPNERPGQTHCCDIGAFRGDRCCWSNFCYFSRCKFRDAHEVQWYTYPCLPLDIVGDVVRLVATPVIFVLLLLLAVVFCLPRKALVGRICDTVGFTLRVPCFVFLQSLGVADCCSSGSS